MFRTRQRAAGYSSRRCAWLLLHPYAGGVHDARFAPSVAILGRLYQRQNLGYNYNPYLPNGNYRQAYGYTVSSWPILPPGTGVQSLFLRPGRQLLGMVDSRFERVWLRRRVRHGWLRHDGWLRHGRLRRHGWSRRLWVGPDGGFGGGGYGGYSSPYGMSSSGFQNPYAAAGYATPNTAPA